MFEFSNSTIYLEPYTQSALFRATKLFNLGDFIAKHDFKDISNVTLAYDDEKLAKEPENFFVETGRGLEYSNIGEKSASHSFIQSVSQSVSHIKYFCLL